MTAPLRLRAVPAATDARSASLVLVGVAVVVCLIATLAQPDSHLAQDGTVLAELVVRVVAVVAAAGVLGNLLLCLCRPRSPGSAADGALVGRASGWALVWVAALVTGFAVELVSPGSVSARAAVGPDAGDAAARLRWLVLGIALAALVRVLCSAVRTRADVGVLLGVTVGGLAVATATGHGGSLLSPSPASVALLAHVLAATAWTGGLLALVAHVRTLGPTGASAPTARAYSRIALVSYVVLALSGALGLLSRTDLAGLLASGGYLVLVLVKAALLLVLGVFGAAQRRTGLARLEAGDRNGFVVLSVGELAVMATAVGLGVALAHSAS